MHVDTKERRDVIVKDTGSHRGVHESGRAVRDVGAQSVFVQDHPASGFDLAGGAPLVKRRRARKWEVERWVES